MKVYIKPTLDFVELRLEESIAGSGSGFAFVPSISLAVVPQATINTSSTMTGAPGWPRISDNTGE